MNIYEPINKNLPGYLSNEELEERLRKGFKSFTFCPKTPLRTRSKIFKTKICEILGFDTPKSFKKTQPTFPIMNFDVYIQDSDNLQIWNQSVSLDRRYVLIKVKNGEVLNVKAIYGYELKNYDKTGTLTKKFQGILDTNNTESKLHSEKDTDNLLKYICDDKCNSALNSTLDKPSIETLRAIKYLFDTLMPLVGDKIKNHDDVRKNGWELHKKCCQLLRYSEIKDNGQYPDIFNQVLEIKLQTSPTIDIGKESPDSTNRICSITELEIRNCDVRYLVVYGEVSSDKDVVIIKKIEMTTGANFFNVFKQMGGLVSNSKIQIPLPKDFWK